MSEKKLFIAVGTTAGETMFSFDKMMEKRRDTGLIYETLYVDTSDELLGTGNMDRNRFHFMKADIRIIRNAKQNNSSGLGRILYEGRSVNTHANGAGGDRYTASVAFYETRRGLREKIEKYMNNLRVQSKGNGAGISFVIVASAVGGTGSGIVDRLLTLLIDIAHDEEVSCDVLILHPGIDANKKRQLANTEALYAEMTAIREMKASRSEFYSGRVLIVGSKGQTVTLANHEELKQTAATIMRLISDQNAGIVQRYTSSVIDRTVLSSPEQETGLLSCFSSATPVVIGLGDLVEQIIRADEARLLGMLVHGGSSNRVQEDASNDLKTAFSFWREDAAKRNYVSLLSDITSRVGNDFKELLPDNLSRSEPVKQAEELRMAWEEEKTKLRGTYTQHMEMQVGKLLERCSNVLHERRAQYIEARTLNQLIADYEKVIAHMEELKLEAGRDQSKDKSITEESIATQLTDLSKARKRDSNALRIKCEEDIELWLKNEKRQIARGYAQSVLNKITKECQDTRTKLSAFVQKAEKGYGKRPGWNGEQPLLTSHSDYPLYIPALEKSKDILRYYHRISFFSEEDESETSMTSSTASKVDMLAQFRQTLKERNLIENFFTNKDGDIFKLIREYIEKEVQHNIGNHTLLDMFDWVGEEVLQERMSIAFERAQALVPFADRYALDHEGVCFVTACCNDRQQTLLEEAKSASRVKETTIFPSKDSTEIVVFYLVDGLSMAALYDLTGKGLEAFIDERLICIEVQKANRGLINACHIYSGRDAEETVIEAEVFKRLWLARSHSMLERDEPAIPEFQ